MPISYYEQAVQGQNLGVLTELAAGINEYFPATVIGDNLMSDLLNVEPWRSCAYLFEGRTTAEVIDVAETVDKGTAVSILASDEVVADSCVFYLMLSLTDNTTMHIAKLVYNYSTKHLVLTEYANLNIPAGESMLNEMVHSTIFRTEADVFYCFVSEGTKELHYIKHTSTSDTYGYTALPAYPVQIVSHANRIFMIDNTNKLWWCRAGDLYSWYAMEYDSDALMASTAMQDAAPYTLTAQPDIPRPFTATITNVGDPDTYGTLALVGTNALDQALSATLTLVAGLNQTNESFKTVTSATGSGHTAAGTADNIEFGWAPVGGFVQEDAGFASIEQESKLLDMCVLNGALYIFSRSNIYIFMGTSYENFSMHRIISGIGVDAITYNYEWRKLTVANNMAYFIYNGDVYEFNGDSQPRIISRPVMQSGKYQNGIGGGISVDTTYYSLSATADYLSLYRISNDTDVPYNYRFVFETRTWWKYSMVFGANLPSPYTSEYLYPLFAPTFDLKEMFYFYNQYRANDVDWAFCFSTTPVVLATTLYPFFITKAFNTIPSAKGTLSDMILEIQGEEDEQATVKVMYSTSTTGTFTTIKEYTAYTFTGDVEIFTIPLPVSAIANVHHYRLKIEITPVTSGTTVKLFDIERRFRIEGRSR